MTADVIDGLDDAWRRELGDLDTRAMTTIARLNRTRGAVIGELERTLEAAGSSLADFDVLAALRRQGPPYRMKPSSLARAILLSASGTTSRVDRLEAAGLVERLADPDNRRTLPVALTDRGLAESERLVRRLVEAEERLLSRLNAAERDELDRLLAKLEPSTTTSD